MLRSITVCNIPFNQGISMAYYFPGCARSIEEALIPYEFEEFLRQPELVITVSRSA